MTSSYIILLLFQVQMQGKNLKLKWFQILEYLCFRAFSVHVNSESYLAENLDRLGNMQSENEADISTAFKKFAVVTKELSALMKNLVCYSADVLLLARPVVILVVDDLMKMPSFLSPCVSLYGFICHCVLHSGKVHTQCVCTYLSPTCD